MTLVEPVIVLCQYKAPLCGISNIYTAMQLVVKNVPLSELRQIRCIREHWPNGTGGYNCGRASGLFDQQVKVRRVNHIPCQLNQPEVGSVWLKGLKEAIEI